MDGQQNHQTRTTDLPRINELHAAWLKFISHCQELSHGEIAKVQIQNGLPVSAEYIKKKIKFT